MSLAYYFASPVRGSFPEQFWCNNKRHSFFCSNQENFELKWRVIVDVSPLVNSYTSSSVPEEKERKQKPRCRFWFGYERKC
jgi:hypothetical protein